MSEMGFMLFQHIASGGETVLCAFCMAVFFRPYTAGRKNRMQKNIAVFLAYGMVYLMGEAFSVSGWLCMVIVILLLMAGGRWLCMERKQVFLYGILFFCTRDMGRLITESLYYLFNGKIVQGLDNENMIYRNVAAGYSAFMVLRIILLLAMLLFLSKKLEKGPPELHTKELCYLCLTPVVGILFENIIFRLLFTVKENVVFSLYGQYPAFIGLVPLIAALFYAGMVVTVASWQEMVGLQEEKKKYFVEQQQLAAIRERIGEVEQFYDGIRRMKHEMKNHLTNIKGLAGSGSYEEMEQYIARMDESMDAFEMSVRTGNAVTDVIVNDKQKAAERMGIRFRSDFVYPASDRYNAYDIAIIVNNLLQNALEACGRMTSGERYISLSGSRKNRFFLISVKNSFEGEVVFDKSTNLPVSTKAPDVPGGPAPLHGIGLSNVRREAAKYLGNVDIKVRKNEFSVTVLLQERSNYE